MAMSADLTLLPKAITKRPQSKQKGGPPGALPIVLPTLKNYEDIPTRVPSIL